MQPAEYMTRVFALAGFILVLGAAFGSAHKAAAQVVPGESPPRHQVLSFTCGELPEDAVFDVTPFSDSDLDLEMARAFAAELRKLQHDVKPGERFEIMLESHIGRGVVEAPPPTLGRLKVRNRGVEVQFNVWSLTEDSLLARRRKETAKETTYLIVTATLRDREAVKALWTGEAAAELRGAKPLAVGQALMPALAEALDCSLNLDGIPEPEK